MTLKWPQRMPENGRLGESIDARSTGYCTVVDPKMSCSQTLHVSLFFDGSMPKTTTASFALKVPTLH
jgi:hypothetical protein